VLFGVLVLTGCTQSASHRAASPAPAAASASAPRPGVSRPVPVPSATPAIGSAVSPPPTLASPPLPSVRIRPQAATARTPAPHLARTAAGSAVVMLRPHDPPQIYGVNLSASAAGGGDVVSGTVTTSSNVASVVASVAGITAGVPKVGVGQFAMSYRLPSLIPPFVKGTYTIVVVARNVDGASASRSVAITLR
jgi:hypothetical protein